MTPRLPVNRGRKHHRLPLCLAIFALLVGWGLVWPFTGDGDAALHYQNLREGAVNPEAMLSAWARPVYALLMLIPAMGGIVVVRCFTALLSTILAWQTMRMADDLGLPAATLAGVMVLWQPLAFALAADTMTEMPMALGIVLAIRLWWARRHALSCLLISFLPMVRPEGFFLIALWALMTLAGALKSSSPRRRVFTCLLLGTGVVCWFTACLLLTGDAMYFIHHWPWPPESFPWYNARERPLLHHIVNWRHYCGPVLFPLFLLGLIPSMRRPMLLPWAVWLVILVVHSVLFWGGWFAALGLMRIMASTSAVTALVCLQGWNLIGRWSRRRNLPTSLRIAATWLIGILGSITPMVYYHADARNHRCFPLLGAVDYIKRNHLLDDAPRFFAGDMIVLAALDYPVGSPQLQDNLWKRKKQLEMLADLPAGSIGVWDNQQAAEWFNVTIEDIETLGYRVLYETKQTLPARSYAGICRRGWDVYQRVVVLQKGPH